MKQILDIFLKKKLWSTIYDNSWDIHKQNEFDIIKNANQIKEKNNGM